MSQNSLTIGNVAASAARTAINNAFDTLNTLHSGTSAPSSPATYQLWYDTTNSLLKIYDGSGWISIGKLDATNNDFHPVIGSWEIDRVGNDLVFKYGGASKMKLTSTGDIVVTGNITAFGTI